jgi:GT2 family glycosyltransferase
VSRPDFSIVVPTYGRPESLRRLLDCLACLDYSPDRFEVMIVDDGSPTPLEPEIAASRNRLNMTLLRQENAGPGAARNFGTERASGEYVAFTDDDCQPDRGWLRALAAAFEINDCAVCGGRPVNLLVRNPYSTATQLLVDYLYRHYNPVDTLGAFFLTNNLAVPREAFLEMGGFDSVLRFGEDRDFCYRWGSRGYPFVYVPEAVVRHAHNLTLRSFLRLHFCYGGGTRQFRRGCAAKGLRPVKLSPPSWYWNLVLSGIREDKGATGVDLTLLLATTQVASALGFFFADGRHRPRRSPRITP